MFQSHTESYVSKSRTRNLGDFQAQDPHQFDGYHDALYDESLVDAQEILEAKLEQGFQSSLIDDYFFEDGTGPYDLSFEDQMDLIDRQLKLIKSER